LSATIHLPRSSSGPSFAGERSIGSKWRNGRAIRRGADRQAGEGRPSHGDLARPGGNDHKEVGGPTNTDLDVLLDGSILQLFWHHELEEADGGGTT
jgi:hypothetical protein